MQCSVLQCNSGSAAGGDGGAGGVDAGGDAGAGGDAEAGGDAGTCLGCLRSPGHPSAV